MPYYAVDNEICKNMPDCSKVLWKFVRTLINIIFHFSSITITNQPNMEHTFKELFDNNLIIILTTFTTEGDPSGLITCKVAKTHADVKCKY